MFTFASSSIPESQSISLTTIPNHYAPQEGDSISTSIIWKARGYTGQLSVTRHLGLRGECILKPWFLTSFDGASLDIRSHVGFTNIVISNYLKIQSHQYNCGTEEGPSPCTDSLVVFYKTDKFFLKVTDTADTYRVVGRSITEEGPIIADKTYSLDFMNITMASSGEEVTIRGVDGVRYFSVSIKLDSWFPIEITSIVLSDYFQGTVSGLCGNYNKVLTLS